MIDLGNIEFEKIWDCQESNLGQLGGKRKRYLCALWSLHEIIILNPVEIEHIYKKSLEDLTRLPSIVSKWLIGRCIRKTKQVFNPTLSRD